VIGSLDLLHELATVPDHKAREMILIGAQTLHGLLEAKGDMASRVGSLHDSVQKQVKDLALMRGSNVLIDGGDDVGLLVDRVVGADKGVELSSGQRGDVAKRSVKVLVLNEQLVQLFDGSLHVLEWLFLLGLLRVKG
jgi:hypothetical protein